MRAPPLLALLLALLAAAPARRAAPAPPPPAPCVPIDVALGAAQGVSLQQRALANQGGVSSYEPNASAGAAVGSRWDSFPITAFLVADAAWGPARERFSGTPADPAQLGRGPDAYLGWYSLLFSALGPADLLAAREVNTLLGEALAQDWPLRFSPDPSGAAPLLVTGIGAGPGGGPPPAARVLDVTRTCNGYVYVLDAEILPADAAGQVAAPVGGLQAAAAAVLFLSGGEALACRGIASPAAVLAAAPGPLAGAAVWRDALAGQPALARRDAALTALLGDDAAVAAAAAAPLPPDLLAFNMLPAKHCPGELLALGEANSMLGVLAGEDLPLLFEPAGGGRVRVSAPGGSGGAAFVDAAAGLAPLCDSEALVLPAVLAPAPAPGGAPRLAALPPALPTAPPRRFTCTQPEFVGAPPAGVANFTSISWGFRAGAAAADGGGDSGGGSGGGLSAGAIAGIAVGCAAAAAAAAAAFAVLRRRRRAAAAGGSGSSGSTQPQTWALPQKSPRAAANAVAKASPWLHASQLDAAALAALEGGTLAAVGLPLGALAALAPGEVAVPRGPDGAPRVLGRGSAGCVVAGVRRSSGAPVAVKVLPLDGDGGAGGEAALLREVAALLRCSDPLVVSCYGAGATEGRLVIVMEMMAGGSLAARLGEPGWGWRGAGGRAVLAAARALTHVHASGVVHFDFKPSNILLDGSGTGAAKLGDLGIAHCLDTRSHVGTLQAPGGTFAYAAPEQILGVRCGPPADVWALGVTLWEVCAGERAARGRMRPLRVPDECPAAVDDLVRACMAAEPAARPTAREAAAALEAAAAADGGA